MSFNLQPKSETPTPEPVPATPPTPLAEQPRGPWLVEHFRWYRKLDTLRFWWWISWEGMLVSVLMIILLALFDAPDRRIRMSKDELFVMAVFAAPVLETLLLQAFPVFIARLVKTSFSAQVFLATVLFAVAHLTEGISAFFAAGIPGGFYFAFTYVHWREKSRWAAFSVTAFSHAFHNFVFVSLYIVGT